MRLSETNGASDFGETSSASGGTGNPINFTNFTAYAERLNSQSLKVAAPQGEGGTGQSGSGAPEGRPSCRREPTGYDVSGKLEILDMRLKECMKRVDSGAERSRELTNALVESVRNEASLLVENYREKTELLIETNRNETILKIEASMRETELLMRSIKESTERTESRFRDDNEKAEGRVERLAREIKDSNNRIHGYTLVNVIGFASILIAIAVLVWSIKTIEITQTPPVSINQTLPAAPVTQTQQGTDYN
ncbi:MAG: hypothetical protein LBS93_03630 [Synergistaceae bacterium]|jgi:hypothetical protein|nr:hypothetical protein [Synergistaceae bacterium]